MAKTANINVRIDPETKEGGLPCEMKQPRYNEETEAAMNEARVIMGGQMQVKHYASVHELFKELDAEEDGASC